MERFFIVIVPETFWILSLFVALGLSVLAARKDDDLKPWIMACAAAWGILGAFWGGHLLYVVATMPDELFENPWLFFYFMDGNKGVFGAFVGAGLFGWLYLRWKKVSCFSYADASVPAIALGYAVARIGCFLNGDDFGTLSSLPWAVQFPTRTLAYEDHLLEGWIQWDDELSLSVHPTQLYHATVGLALFFILRRWKSRWPGSRLAFALAGYGVTRFALQFFRGDSVPVLGHLDINHIYALIFLSFAGLLWWRLDYGVTH